MARGWESKSVEEQIESGKSDSSTHGKLKMSLAQAERKRKRDVLEAARANTVRQLKGTENPRYRTLLSEELQSLDRQIELLQA